MGRPKIHRSVTRFGDIAIVELSKCKTAIIDAEDADRVSRHTWTAHPSSNNFYAYTTINRRTLSLHRFIMEPKGGLYVDHIDSDGLNCRRANLRLATQTQNCQNSRKSAKNTSGYKGVFYRPDRQKWQAQIRVEGKRVCLGTFASVDEAGAAYAEAAATYFGDFARLA
jgi:hypothetical protein